MANDISYFKGEGDETQYSFNDADLEARIGATALPTTAQTITGAIAEHEGDISTLNSKIKFTEYTNVTQLGLTSGSATVVAVYSAMATPGRFVGSNDQFASGDVPSGNGTVVIEKLSAARGYVWFYGKGSTPGDYRMFLGARAYNGNDSNLPTGEWIAEPTRAEITALNSDLPIVPFTAASKQAITDFNDCKTGGVYKATTNASNKPANGYYVFFVLPYSSSDVAQLAIEINTGNTWARSWHDGATWSSWKQLHNS